MAKNSTGDLRSQLKATPIKKLKKRIDEDNEIIGAQSNEYLSLEDGKTLKIRIFPAHPGHDDFYIAKKCYWLTISGSDGESKCTTVLDSRVHGGTKYDLVEEYTKWAKKKWAKDSDKLEALTGQQNSLNPSYSWICYAAKISGDESLRAKLWEFKKTVRDRLNNLAFSEDEDEAIEVDPFTDVDEGLPVMVKYMKNPNKKRGENFYEVNFPKKVAARPLTDEEIEYFMTLKPLNEVLLKYGIKDFEKALEGLQNFDEKNEIGLFDDDDWLEHVEEIKAQYDDDESNDDDDEKPVKKKTFKKTKVVSEEEEAEEESNEEEDNDDELDDMDRTELKKYIKENDLSVTIKKSMSDDDIREAIREAMSEDSDEDEDEESNEDEEEDKPKAKVSLSDIRKKLAGK